MPLILAATPIGNIGDASQRLRDALQTADVIAAEDTRRLRRLTSALGIAVTARVVASYDAVERDRADALLEVVRGGGTVLVVTDAGMPLVSDPGHVLVTAAVAADLPVSVLPGPSAVLAALAVSGLPVDRFCFEGFLPRKAGERRARLHEVVDDRRAIVLFEAPHRLAACLADLADVLGAGRRAAVCRELTKLHEEVRRGDLAGLAGWATDSRVRGEITIVVEGATAAPPVIDDQAVAVAVAEEMAAGRSRRDAVEVVAARFGVARNAAYQASLRHR